MGGDKYKMSLRGSDIIPKTPLPLGSHIERKRLLTTLLSRLVSPNQICLPLPYAWNLMYIAGIVCDQTADTPDTKQNQIHNYLVTSHHRGVRLVFNGLARQVGLCKGEFVTALWFACNCCRGTIRLDCWAGWQVLVFRCSAQVVQSFWTGNMRMGKSDFKKASVCVGQESRWSQNRLRNCPVFS
ncbi:hypothetical protein VTK73DRAFT_7641 [Phialemonium thermophilum]|uniref:Uncharacterized protein n=1 Tax=Phialemonium thermophilum TaxID=223376 RepID=A0ABR3Y6D2_9PEZI